jgi:V8-like Glu-specific endopeptidase
MKLPEERKTQLPDLDKLLSDLGANPVETLSQTFAGTGPKARAIVGAGELELATPEAAPDDTSVDLAEAGVRAATKLQEEGPDAEFTPEEVLGLEAIILIEGRPPILIQDGKFFPPPSQWAHLEEHRTSIEEAFRSVGRVEATGLPGLPFVGTGFLVADDVVMTNRHVAEVFSSQGAGNAWSFKPGMTARIDYAEEIGSVSPAEFALTEVIGVHDTLDLALFRVESTSPSGALAPEPLTISSTPPAVTNEVFVVGYPAADPERNDPEVMRRLFGNVYNVKRLQPGVITRLIDVERELLHDCSTLGGNSGSCVIDLQMSQVVGLHYAGRYREANHAVALWQLTNDPLLTSAGVNFD